MQTTEANKILEGIVTETEKSGINVDKFIPLIQKAREYALQENDPLITRALRLLWQHLEGKEGFQLSFLEEAESQEENFNYFVNLCIKSDNTYNRDELREMTNMLQEMP